MVAQRMPSRAPRAYFFELALNVSSTMVSLVWFYLHAGRVLEKHPTMIMIHQHQCHSVLNSISPLVRGIIAWPHAYTSLSESSYLVRLGTSTDIVSHIPSAKISMGLGPVKEWSESMLQVAAHYDQDGWCVFGSRGVWASECAVSRRKRNVVNFVLMFLSF